VFPYPLPSGETSLNNANLVAKLYLNTGKGGGTRQRGDGDRYCDMRGTGAGKRCYRFRRQPFNLVSDDYIWIDKAGSLTLFRNYHNPPYWGQGGIIYVPGDLMIGHTRQDVFLADRKSLARIQIR
jgi:hypothetical protein